MEVVRHTRRWLMRLIPATAVALSSLGTSQADVFQFGKDAKTSYSVILVSLIPHAPKNKKSAMVKMKAGERLAVRQYLDLPLVLEIQPDQLAGVYDVHVLNEQGKEINNMRIGHLATATFIDQRLQVMFSVA